MWYSVGRTSVHEWNTEHVSSILYVNLVILNCAYICRSSWSSRFNCWTLCTGYDNVSIVYCRWCGATVARWDQANACLSKSGLTPSNLIMCINRTRVYTRVHPSAVYNGNWLLSDRRFRPRKRVHGKSVLMKLYKCASLVRGNVATRSRAFLCENDNAYISNRDFIAHEFASRLHGNPA